jgi:mannose-6-phosphate isomerase-like protein (cupin superfamily)
MVVPALVAAFLFAQAFAQRPKFQSTPKPSAAATELSADAAFRSVFRNQRVQVWRLELAPGASTQLDHHGRDYIVLAVTAADLETSAGQMAGQRLQMQPEEMQIVKGGWAHQTRNQGRETAVVIEIEPLAPLDPEHAVCGLSARGCISGEFGDVIGEYNESVLFETGSAILKRTEISAGAQYPSREFKHDLLLVAATPAQVRDHTGVYDSPAANLNDRQLALEPGDCAWFVAGTRHSLTNTGQKDAHFLMLEIK